MKPLHLLAAVGRILGQAEPPTVLIEQVINRLQLENLTLTVWRRKGARLIRVAGNRADRSLAEAAFQGEQSACAVLAQRAGITVGILTTAADSHALLPVLAPMIAPALSQLNLVNTHGRLPLLLGKSKAARAVQAQITRVAHSGATVLLRGESGVGKELVAQTLHAQGPRREGPFITVNCAALPRDLLESELFGHEQGAFTGAMSRHLGRFEQAQGGTLFLDEVGDLPLSTQVALLRVLQEREFRRVGGVEAIPLETRVITATHRDLEALVEAETFRADLYYRINVFPIRVPPLRECSTDITLLADHFVAHYALANDKQVRRIDTPAIDMMLAYHWPGNIRELANVIERAVLVADGSVIHGHHLPPSLQIDDTPNTQDRTLKARLATFEQGLLENALKKARGNRAKAARALGITERIMGLRVAQYSLDASRFKTKRSQ